MHSEMELRELIATYCGVSIHECLNDVTLFTLGIDSLALASLVARCETDLHIELDDESIQSIMASQNIGEVVSHLQSAQRTFGNSTPGG
jgi:acyl carrier protein